MNIAIIFSVSNYIHENPLPGCKNDALLMTEILRSTSKYEDILVLDKSQESSLEKQELIEFISKYTAKEIDEVFFYYSGHGDFDGREFYYLLSDYDEKRQKQTSLENSELDNFLRSLKPKTTIKVVDACHSGVEYVKEKSNFYQYIKGTEQDFTTCYFMYSSESNQSSYADNNISYFTRAFAESIVSKKAENIRYKDITDYISDAFQNNNEQEPLFVCQANLTEVFFIKDQEFNDRINSLLQSFGTSTTPIRQGVSSVSFIEKVKADADRYCTEEEAMNIIEKIQSDCYSIVFDGDLVELYDLKWDESSYYSSNLDISEIGRWFKRNNDVFFVKPEVEHHKIEYEEPKDNYRNTIYALGGVMGLQRKRRPQYEEVVVGVRSTAELPYKQLTLSANPKYPNLQKTGLILIPFLSKTDIIIFYTTFNFKEFAWKKEAIPDSIKWLYQQIPLKNDDVITNFINTTVNSFKDFTLNQVMEKFNTVEGEIIEDSETAESI